MDEWTPATPSPPSPSTCLSSSYPPSCEKREGEKLIGGEEWEGEEGEEWEGEEGEEWVGEGEEWEGEEGEE